MTRINCESVGVDEAIRRSANYAWVGMTDKQIALWQLRTVELFIPINVLLETCSSVLKRPVRLAELAQPDLLIAEIKGEDIFKPGCDWADLIERKKSVE